jgi:hypothetical protein
MAPPNPFEAAYWAYNNMFKFLSIHSSVNKEFHYFSLKRILVVVAYPLVAFISERRHVRGVNDYSPEAWLSSKFLANLGNEFMLQERIFAIRWFLSQTHLIISPYSGLASVSVQNIFVTAVMSAVCFVVN